MSFDRERTKLIDWNNEIRSEEMVPERGLGDNFLRQKSILSEYKRWHGLIDILSRDRYSKTVIMQPLSSPKNI